MTDTTINLGLPVIAAAQAQKHVTHNEALRILDTLVQLAVLDCDLADPPGSPTEGQRWIVAASPTDAWAGHADDVAAWQDGAWQFSTPQIGWIAFVVDEGTLLVWNGSSWGDFFSTVTSIQNLALLGVGTSADAANPFSAKLNKTLWTAKTAAEGGDGDLRFAVNKESVTDTASYLFQTGFSGRAEIGLTGDDDFHFKVSPDGTAWHDGIVIDKNSGAVTFPNTNTREVLGANRTYYVRTDGSDGNDGLSNTAGGAFLTIQKAIDVVTGTLDLHGFDVTIQVADGTYTAGVSLSAPQTGKGTITIQGNNATPANVIISTTAADAVYVGKGAVLQINDMELRTTTSGFSLHGDQGGFIGFQNLRFGAAAYHVVASDGGHVTATGNYSITGSAGNHFNAQNCGTVRAAGKTITLMGTPAFSIAFAQAAIGGVMIVNSNTYSGSATGARYSAFLNGVVFANGGTLPGSTAGTTATGGQFA